MFRYFLPLVVVFCLAAVAEEPKHKTIGVDEFETVIKNADVVILDVRTPAEYEKGRIKGSLLINFNDKDFEAKIKALDKTKTYAVYCASGNRSGKASAKLDSLSFIKVFNLDGGIKAWEKAGKPTEK